MTEVSFTVAGIPAPQGSKSPWGSEANPNTKPWRAAVAADARAAMTYHDADGTSGYLEPIAGPVVLYVTFTFPRPKSHYRTGRHAHELKPSAPAYCATKPDLDKLLRAIGDAITGIVVRDDSQIVEIVASKWYGAPSAVVTVESALGGGG